MYAKYIKRILDFLLSLFALIILSPVFLTIYFFPVLKNVALLSSHLLCFLQKIFFSVSLCVYVKYLFFFWLLLRFVIVTGFEEFDYDVSWYNMIYIYCASFLFYFLENLTIWKIFLENSFLEFIKSESFKIFLSLSFILLETPVILGH